MVFLGGQGEWSNFLTRLLAGWAASLMVCVTSYGLGLGVSGGAGVDAHYYEISNGKLYRFFCPEGAVISKSTCIKKDTSFLIAFSAVSKSIESDLHRDLKQTADSIQQEITNLKEQNPEVQKLRSEIRSQLASVSQGEKDLRILADKQTKVESNLQAVNESLKTVVSRLAKDLPQDELLRVVEVHSELVKQKAALETELSQIQMDLNNIKTALTTVNDKVASMSAKLGRLLPTLIVQSDKLIELQARKISLEAQINLIPELEKRLEDDIAYPVKAWVETGLPGVQEFVERFLSHADSMGKGEIISSRYVQ